MKGSKAIVLLLLLLIGVAIFVFTNDDGSTLNKTESEFAIEQIDEIQRIFIVDPEGHTADLRKHSDSLWTVNDKYKARQDGVDLILSTANKIAVKDHVPKSAVDNVIRKLAASAIKVEFYSTGDKPDKVYYVGHATQNHFGTYMLLEAKGEKSSVPYITYVPGNHGFLTTRFFADEVKWRDRQLFDLGGDLITEFSMHYGQEPHSSYQILKNESSFVLKDNAGNISKKADPLVLSNFMKIVPKLHFEFFITNMDEQRKDSILSSAPLHIISVQSENGKSVSLKTFHKPVLDGKVNIATGEPFDYNVDRLYGLLNDEMVSIQWLIMDQLTLKEEDFMIPDFVNN